MSQVREVVGYEIDEPRAWPWDGDLTRRAEVFDYNFNPPRVVRRCGYRHCLRCRKPFWSPDCSRIRLCSPCKTPAQFVDDKMRASMREADRRYKQRLKVSK